MWRSYPDSKPSVTGCHPSRKRSPKPYRVCLACGTQLSESIFVVSPVIERLKQKVPPSELEAWIRRDLFNWQHYKSAPKVAAFQELFSRFGVQLQESSVRLAETPGDDPYWKSTPKSHAFEPVLIHYLRTELRERPDDERFCGALPVWPWTTAITNLAVSTGFGCAPTIQRMCAGWWNRPRGCCTIRGMTPRMTSGKPSRNSEELSPISITSWSGSLVAPTKDLHGQPEPLFQSLKAGVSSARSRQRDCLARRLAS